MRQDILKYRRQKQHTVKENFIKNVVHEHILKQPDFDSNAKF